MFSPELRVKAESLVARYPVSRSALLPLLHLVQAQDGHVSDDGVAECAELLALTKAEVGAVASFYTMYKRAPLGRHLVSVCTNFACKVRGAQEVYDQVSAHLSVGHNGTTEDGALTLEHAECLGNCEGAPVVTVDYLNYECLTPQAAVDLVDALRAGQVPAPTRGYASGGIRDVQYRLAGMGPANGDARVGASLVDTAAAQPRATDDQAIPQPDAGPTVGDAPTDVLVREDAGGQEPFSPQEDRRQDAVEADVQRATGEGQGQVESQSAYSAREFPSTDPARDPATTYPANDPRTSDQEPPQPAGERDRSRTLTDGAGTDGIADHPVTEELGEKRSPQQLASLETEDDRG